MKKHKEAKNIESLKVGAAYIRASTDDQLEYSPESQIKKVQEYAKREGYFIPSEYIFQDDGISGKAADKRPAFRVMIGMAKTDPPPFDCIFVWEFSRFARNQEESIMYKNLLRKKGIAVKSVREPLADSPFASLIERIIEWMDEYYLINLAIEVRRGMGEKATRGEAMGKPPFGYSVQDKQYVPDENADIVRYIFTQYDSGIGYRTIAHELADKGVRTKAGRAPVGTWVQYILHNPAYIGKIRWSEEGKADYIHPLAQNENVILADGKHEPIIDMALWERVQARLSRKSTEARYCRRGEANVFMLKGLIRCGDCGSTLTRVFKGDRASLQCCGYSRAECRVSHSILLEKANAAVLGGLRACCENDLFTFMPPARAEEPKLTRDWEKLIATENEKLARARDAFLDGIFTAQEYAEAKQTLTRNVELLEQAKAAEAAPAAPAQEKRTAETKSAVLSVLNLLESPDIPEKEKNEALRSVLDKIIYNKPENTFDFFFTP